MTEKQEKAVRDASKLLDEAEDDLARAEERLSTARGVLSNACKRAEACHDAVVSARKALEAAIKGDL